jgi:putative nucleotidyltransferase with HDIG domain
MGWFDRLRGRGAPAAVAGPSGRPTTAGTQTSTPRDPRAPPSATPARGPSPESAKFLKRVGELEAMPGVASRLLQALDDPSVGVDVISQEVRRDQALMAMVLRMANSAFYKSSGQVRDITESIVVLGYDTTRQLVLGRLSRQVLRKNDVWQKTLWRHALATALGAQACARQVRGVTVGHAFTAGLLHDIGKAVMHEACPDECVDVWKTLATSNRPSDEVEREQFGTDHTEVGAELLRIWQFPPMYENAARLHSRAASPLSDQKDQRIVSIVALSGAVASWLGHDAAPDRKGSEPREHPAIADLGAAPGITEVMRSHIEKELRPLVDIFR